MIEGVLGVLLAPECLVCGAPLASVRPLVCPPCWASLDLLPGTQCFRCAAPLPPGTLNPGRARCERCAEGDSPLARVHACGRYDGVLRALIHEFKYHGRTSLA